MYWSVCTSSIHVKVTVNKPMFGILILENDFVTFRLN